MNNIRITLQSTLDKYNLTANQVATTAQIRPSTLYDMMNDKTMSVTYKTLTSIVKALRELTEDELINVEDVLIYED